MHHIQGMLQKMPHRIPRKKTKEFSPTSQQICNFLCRQENCLRVQKNRRPQNNFFPLGSKVKAEV